MRRVGECGLALSSRLGFAVLLLIYPTYSIIDGWVKPFVSRSSHLFWTHDIAAKLLVPVIVLIAIRYLYGREIHGLCRIQNNKFLDGSFGYFTVIAVVAGLFGLLVQHVLSFRWPPPQIIPEIAMQETMDFPWKIIVWAYFSVTAAVFEELFFRGGIYRLVHLLSYNKMPQGVTNTLFVLLSAAVFSLAHWENGYANMAYALVVGIAYSGLYLKANTIWPFVTSHLFLNFLALIWR